MWVVMREGENLGEHFLTKKLPQVLEKGQVKKPESVYVVSGDSERSERYVWVRIVAIGRKWSLSTPKGNGRDVMLFWVYVSDTFNKSSFFLLLSHWMGSVQHVIKIRQLFLRPAACLTSTLLGNINIHCTLIPLSGVGTTCFLLPFSPISRLTLFILMPSFTQSIHLFLGRPLLGWNTK
jgi:hypothetical protein